MAFVSFASLQSAEVLDLDFLKLGGDYHSLRLLVDTGFSGKSSIVLGVDKNDLIRAVLPPAETTGALTGSQRRAWVTCRIPALDFQATMIAIITDVSVLSLPPGVEGMVGLTFLRHFARWGSEKTAQGWHFHLVSGEK